MTATTLPVKPRRAPRPGATDLHGVPHDQAGDLADVLSYCRRHRDAGRPDAEVRADALSIARGLGLPLFSAGGAADAIDTLIGEARPRRPLRRTLHLKPLCPRCGRLAPTEGGLRLSLPVLPLCPRCRCLLPERGAA